MCVICDFRRSCVLEHFLDKQLLSIRSLFAAFSPTAQETKWCQIMIWVSAQHDGTKPGIRTVRTGLEEASPCTSPLFFNKYLQQVIPFKSTKCCFYICWCTYDL